MKKILIALAAAAATGFGAAALADEAISSPIVMSNGEMEQIVAGVHTDSFYLTVDRGPQSSKTIHNPLTVPTEAGGSTSTSACPNCRGLGHAEGEGEKEGIITFNWVN